MPTNKLTEAQVRNARPKAGAPYKLTDGQGMYLFVTPAGSRVWRLAYRLHAKQQTAVLGQYPDMTLAQARAARAAFRDKLSGGFVPAKKPTVRRETVTFEQACQTYWNARKDITDKYRDNALRGLQMYLIKPLGGLPVGHIGRDELLAALNEMDAAGLHNYVRKVRLWASSVFDWAVEQGHASANPALQINPAKAFSHAPVENFAALELNEVPELWQRLHLEGELTSVLACKLLAYTWTRTKELRSMRWSEIDGSVWRIAAAQMKRRKDHVVPLSKQAVEILKELRKRSRQSEYVFPAEHRDDRPMSDSAILMLLYRMGYKGKMTGHGWRSCGSTWANENQFDKDAIERQLAHSPDDKVRAAYNRAAYLDERRLMLQAWADWLDSCLQERKGARSRNNADAVGNQGRKTPAHRAVGQLNVRARKLAIA